MEIGKIRLVSLLVFAMSVMAMIVIRLFYKIPVLKPEMINESLIGRDVVVEGVVTYSKPGKTSFMKLNSLDVVFFDNISAEKGELLRIYGRVSRYKGKLEIIGKRILSRQSIKTQKG